MYETLEPGIQEHLKPDEQLIWHGHPHGNKSIIREFILNLNGLSLIGIILLAKWLLDYTGRLIHEPWVLLPILGVMSIYLGYRKKISTLTVCVTHDRLLVIDGRGKLLTSSPLQDVQITKDEQNSFISFQTRGRRYQAWICGCTKEQIQTIVHEVGKEGRPLSKDEWGL